VSRVRISEEESLEAPPASDFQRRHPVLMYLLEDMVKGFYVVGCLALNLFAPIQLRMSFPGQDAIILPPAIIGVIVLSYVEYRTYRRIWPQGKARKAVALVDRRDS